LVHQHARVRGGPDHAIALLRDVQQAATGYLPPDLSRRLEVAIGALENPRALPLPEDDRIRSEMLLALDDRLAKQCLDLEAFRIDGPAHARQLVRFLEVIAPELGLSPPPGLLSASECDPLQATSDEIERTLEGLRQAVDVVRQGARRQPTAPGPSGAIADLDDLLHEVSRCVSQVPLTATDRIADAIADFRDSLDEHPAVEQMIEQYSAVVAGTCQQVMPGSDYGTRRVYETVIVDEAARANPLDLLIPLSLGKRLVLVGDHKQLPHVLEPTVVKRLSAEAGDDVAAFLEVSLFERLYRRFSDEQLSGGPRRVMTLLDDFRMHPVISHFVGNQFYAEENITPRRQAAERAHDLGIYDNKPVCWIDVPRTHGGEQGGWSKWRPAESRIAADEVKRVLLADQEGSFSVGLITFYERQKQDLEDHLSTFPQAFLDRVKVGTVDAFQGLEFDIVFLSTVRSNSEPDELRRFGFLGRPNRLCVALSRARRLLVVVGDAATVAGPDKCSGVPALRAFLDLCHSSAGYYEQR
jgi:hypothetical protein